MRRTFVGWVLAVTIATVSCGPERSATSPTSAATTPPAAVSASAASFTPDAGSAPQPGPESESPPEFEIPHPFVVVARAAGHRAFEPLVFEDESFVAACFEDDMAGGCLQPHVARVVNGELVPADELLGGLPPLREVNLAAEPHGKFKGIRPKADSVRRKRACLKGPFYPGPRALTGVYGRLEDNAWAVVTAFGEEPANEALSDLYRWDGSAWQHVYNTNALQVEVLDVVRWRGGAAVLLSDHGDWKWTTLQARRGAPAPKWPKDLNYGEQVLRGFGNSRISGYYAGLQGSLTVLTWSRLSSRPIRLDLPRILDSGECGGDRYVDPQVEIHSANEMTIRAVAGLPVDQAIPKDGFKPRPIEAKVKLVRGRFRVVEQRELDAAESAKLCAEPEPLIASLRANPQFEVRKHWRIGDDLHVSVRVRREPTADAEHAEEALLLRTRAAPGVWALADEQRLEAPRPPSDPECEKRLKSTFGPMLPGIPGP